MGINRWHFAPKVCYNFLIDQALIGLDPPAIKEKPGTKRHTAAKLRDNSNYQNTKTQADNLPHRKLLHRLPSGNRY